MVHNDRHEGQNGFEKMLKRKDGEDEAIFKKFKLGKGVLSEDLMNRTTIKSEAAADGDDFLFYSDDDDDDSSEYKNKMESKGVPRVEMNFIADSNNLPTWTVINPKREIDSIVPITTIRFRNILQPTNSPNILRNVSFNLSIEGVYSSPSNLSKRSSLKRSFTSSALCIH